MLLMLFKIEHAALKARADKLTKMLAIQGLTNELLVEMQKLSRDVDELAGRVADEMERLGLNE